MNSGRPVGGPAAPAAAVGGSLAERRVEPAGRQCLVQHETCDGRQLFWSLSGSKGLHPGPHAFAVDAPVTDRADCATPRTSGDQISPLSRSRISDRDHDLPLGVAGLQIAHRLGRLAQGIRAVNHRSHLTLLDHGCEGLEIGAVRLVRD